MLRKYSLIPLALTVLAGALPAFAQEDPRNWEQAVTHKIFKAMNNGSISQAQADFRQNEVWQVQCEHQAWLNQNGAPQGNVLTPDERQTIRSQLDAVMSSVDGDIRGNKDHHGFNWAQEHNHEIKRIQDEHKEFFNGQKESKIDWSKEPPHPAVAPPAKHKDDHHEHH